MAHLVDQAALIQQISVDSAGTHCLQAGMPVYFRTTEMLHQNGIRSFSSARQLQYEDLNTFDHILAMDRRNLAFMLRHSAGCRADIRLLLHDAQKRGLVTQEEVGDPYPDGDFAKTYALIHAGCTALLERLRSV